MTDYTYIVWGLIAAGAISIWYILKIKIVNKRIREAEQKAKAIEETSQQDVERLKKEKLLEAKDKIFKWRMDAEKEIQEQRKKSNEVERRLSEKEHGARRDARRLDRKRRELDHRLRSVRKREAQAEDLNPLAYLVKPVTPDDIKPVIDSALK